MLFVGAMWVENAMGFMALLGVFFSLRWFIVFLSSMSKV